MKKLSEIVTCLILLNSFTLFSQTSSYCHLAGKIPLPGDGGWDLLAVDELTERLFVSHSNVVQVIDLKEGKLFASIDSVKGVHGIALADDMHKGFISNGKDSSITIFDIEKLTFIEKVYVTGKNPDAILYDPFSHRVFTFNGGGHNSTVIDAASNKVLGTIDLDGKPELAVSNGIGKIYVNIEDKNVVKVINPITMKVEKEWKLFTGEEPSGMAIDLKNHLLFIVCSNKLMVIMDEISGKIITTLMIGERVDGVAFDPVLNRVYSSNGDGTMTVVQEINRKKFNILENFPTQKGARTIAIDKFTHHLYLPSADFGPAPAPTRENPRPRPSILPGTFVILDIEPLN